VSQAAQLSLAAQLSAARALDPGSIDLLLAQLAAEHGTLRRRR
jgi:hypothetical protein